MESLPREEILKVWHWLQQKNFNILHPQQKAIFLENARLGVKAAYPDQSEQKRRIEALEAVASFFPSLPPSFSILQNNVQFGSPAQPVHMPTGLQHTPPNLQHTPASVQTSSPSLPRQEHFSSREPTPITVKPLVGASSIPPTIVPNANPQPSQSVNLLSFDNFSTTPAAATFGDFSGSKIADSKGKSGITFDDFSGPNVGASGFGADTSFSEFKAAGTQKQPDMNPNSAFSGFQSAEEPTANSQSNFNSFATPKKEPGIISNEAIEFSFDNISGATSEKSVPNAKPEIPLIQLQFDPTFNPENQSKDWDTNFDDLENLQPPEKETTIDDLIEQNLTGKKKRNKMKVMSKIKVKPSAPSRKKDLFVPAARELPKELENMSELIASASKPDTSVEKIDEEASNCSGTNIDDGFGDFKGVESFSADNQSMEGGSQANQKIGFDEEPEKQPLGFDNDVPSQPLGFDDEAKKQPLGFDEEPQKPFGFSEEPQTKEQPVKFVEEPETTEQTLGFGNEVPAQFDDDDLGWSGFNTNDGVSQEVSAEEASHTAPKTAVDDDWADFAQATGEAADQGGNAGFEWTDFKDPKDDQGHGKVPEVDEEPWGFPDEHEDGGKLSGSAVESEEPQKTEEVGGLFDAEKSDTLGTYQSSNADSNNMVLNPTFDIFNQPVSESSEPFGVPIIKEKSAPTTKSSTDGDKKASVNPFEASSSGSSSSESDGDDSGQDVFAKFGVSSTNSPRDDHPTSKEKKKAVESEGKLSCSRSDGQPERKLPEGILETGKAEDEKSQNNTDPMAFFDFLTMPNQPSGSGSPGDLDVLSFGLELNTPAAPKDEKLDEPALQNPSSKVENTSLAQEKPEDPALAPSTPNNDFTGSIETGEPKHLSIPDSATRSVSSRSSARSTPEPSNPNTTVNLEQVLDKLINAERLDEALLCKRHIEAKERIELLTIQKNKLMQKSLLKEANDSDSDDERTFVQIAGILKEIKEMKRKTSSKETISQWRNDEHPSKFPSYKDLKRQVAKNLDTFLENFPVPFVKLAFEDGLERAAQTHAKAVQFVKHINEGVDNNWSISDLKRALEYSIATLAHCARATDSILQQVQAAGVSDFDHVMKNEEGSLQTLNTFLSGCFVLARMAGQIRDRYSDQQQLITVCSQVDSIWSNICSIVSNLASQKLTLPIESRKDLVSLDVVLWTLF